MAKFIDKTGLRIGEVTVLRLAEERPFNCTAWVVRCDCGKERIVPTAQLRPGRVSTCGEHLSAAQIARNRAIAQKNTVYPTGFGARSRLYNTWRNMLARCENPNLQAYKNYGGRGIKVCPEWHEYTPFLEWARSNGYASNLSIERKDNDGDYTPNNCCWATNSEQARNKRSKRQAAADYEKQLSSQ